MREPPDKTTVKAPRSLTNFSDRSAVYFAKDTDRSSLSSKTRSFPLPFSDEIAVSAIAAGDFQVDLVEFRGARARFLDLNESGGFLAGSNGRMRGRGREEDREEGRRAGNAQRIADSMRGGFSVR